MLPVRTTQLWLTTENMLSLSPGEDITSLCPSLDGIHFFFQAELLSPLIPYYLILFWLYVAEKQTNLNLKTSNNDNHRLCVAGIWKWHNKYGSMLQDVCAGKIGGGGDNRNSWGPKHPLSRWLLHSGFWNQSDWFILGPSYRESAGDLSCIVS